MYTYTHTLSLYTQVGATLRVLNLSQQSDSSDLMGGFKPVDPGSSITTMLQGNVCVRV